MTGRQEGTVVALAVEVPVALDVEVFVPVEVGVLGVVGVELVVGVDGVDVELLGGVCFDGAR